jgi:glycosyltransferase involved in cell wall biosynthesis
MEEQIFTLARAFREQDSVFLPVYLAPPDPDCQAQYRDAGLALEFLAPARSLVANIAYLRRLLSRHRIEVIHWNFLPPLKNPLLWAVSLLAPHVRHYITDHISRAEPQSQVPRSWKRTVKHLLLRRYERIIGVSEFVVRDLLAQGVWPTPRCCPHFINTDRFAPDPAAGEAVRHRIGDREAFVVITVAHLIPQKGVDVAIRALPLLPEHVVLWVIGAGPELEYLEHLAYKLQVAQRVRFLGPQAHVEPYLQAADVFVCPSRWGEAAGLVNLEAQATGLPVVASETGGIPEHVQHGRTGLLFPPGDPVALARLVRLLADHPETRRTMGREARRWAVERFSIPARLEDYLELYRAP